MFGAPIRTRPPRRKLRKRDFAWILAPGAALMLLLGIGHAAGYRVNETSSAPVGLWRVAPIVELHPGMRVTLCLPPDVPIIRIAIERRYLASGECAGGYAPLLKEILAGPGDVVDFAPGATAVNGAAPHEIAVLDTDSRGRNLPHTPFGRYTLGADQYWLFSDLNPRSLDSRYFGPVTRDRLIAAATPVLTFDPR
jgi:conjugative transfer signal peptidase TraF